MKKLLVILFFLPLLVGINNLTDGYRVTAAGGSARIYAKDGGAQGACYTVQNNHASSDFFVPTKTTTEWSTFASATVPAFVVKTQCYPKSCKEIKNLMLNPADGYYTIDSDGAGANASYLAYCDMTLDGGGWTRVFRHHIQGGYFATVSGAITANVGTPTADLYSVLDKIPDFLAGGRYTFRHTWPGYAQKNIWSQTTNPLLEIDAAGALPYGVTAYAQSKILGWGGIELGNGAHTINNGFASLIDGSVEHSNWFFAIGQTVPWATPAGIPADTSISGAGVSETVLWIRDEVPTNYNSCKAILDAGASVGSGLYTIDPGNLGSPIPVYCDMVTDGGGWTRAFYHTVSGALFVSNAEALNSNQSLPLTTSKYSILNRLTGFLRSGKYELKINWPLSGSSIKNIWTQTSDFTSQPVAGYIGVSIGTSANGWGGLEAGGAGVSLADGSVGSGSYWYAIGLQTAWGSPQGLPSSEDVSGGPSTGVPRVELWIK